MHFDSSSRMCAEVTVGERYRVCRWVAPQATLRQTLLKANKCRQRRIPMTMLTARTMLRQCTGASSVFVSSHCSAFAPTVMSCSQCPFQTLFQGVVQSVSRVVQGLHSLLSSMARAAMMLWCGNDAEVQRIFLPHIMKFEIFMQLSTEHRSSVCTLAMR